ncbi:hypothetical protein DFH06DRAFT_1347400 [Mycena polygramma]|nr:hypothetical protein DFH06DRAFT_1347400 [Mycena polygramma]
MAERKIQTEYTPDILTDAVADYAVMLALMASRRAGQTYSFVNDDKASSASGVLKRLGAFGITHCIYTQRPGALPQTGCDERLRAEHDVSVAPVHLPALARGSGVLFVLAAGLLATRYLVHQACLRLTRPTNVLVNKGHGAVVDSAALTRALKDEGWIWGAGLDVVEEESRVGAQHPLVQEPRCVVLPHIGSPALETRAEMVKLTARNVLAGVLCEPLPAALDHSTLI